ncbi:MAG: hypothetical protein E7417_06170 [Ruminococcaceae bacterium]|nr:hypothetical protein [Oscillospiraceae bacterium]
MKRRRKKTRKFLNLDRKKITILSISLAVIILAFVVVIGIGSFVTEFPEFEQYENADVVEIDKSTGKVNALLVGVDRGGSLTDTIMVASYDLDKNQINILSVPRDTRMYIGSKYQKINSAHAISKNGKKKGINGTIEAVTRLTGIPINYYVEFTFSAFRDTIDALGGVEFDVPQNMNYDDSSQNLHIHLKKGLQTLDGEKAEQFVRFRRYPMGDIDRVAAQQAFVKAVAEQKLNASIIGKLPDLYKALQKNLITNISLGDITKYLPNLKDLSAENVYMHSVPGVSNGTDYGASYWIPNMSELAYLIENTFGYDASRITVHSSADKNSATETTPKKPSSTVSPSPKPTTDPESETKATPKPEEEKKATPKPTASPTKKPTKKTEEKTTPKPTAKPTAKPTEKPEETATPTATPAPTSTPMPTQPPLPYGEGLQLKPPTQEKDPTPAPTKAPVVTPAPTVAPTPVPTKAPVQNEKPSRPEANIAGSNTNE